MYIEELEHLTCEGFLCRKTADFTIHIGDDQRVNLCRESAEEFARELMSKVGIKEESHSPNPKFLDSGKILHIMMIKMIRERFGIGLKEAKDFVDEDIWPCIFGQEPKSVAECTESVTCTTNSWGHKASCPMKSW